jgi:hypothetical protein
MQQLYLTDALEPADRLTKVCAIMGHPPPEEKPFKILALPGQYILYYRSLLFPVISSTKFIVSNPSVNPTQAIIIWKNYLQGFKLKVISGI